MTTQPVVYIDRSEIVPGKRGDVEAAIEALVAFVDEHEPQLLAYSFYIDTDPDRMTVIAIHPDAGSIEYHMDIAAERFRGFEGLIKMTGIEIYGSVNDHVREQLRAKAEMLGGDAVVIREQHAGFSHLA